VKSLESSWTTVLFFFYYYRGKKVFLLSKKDGKNTYTCKQFFNDQYACGKDQITLIWLFFSHLKIKIIISLLQLTTYHVYCYHKTTTGFRVFINKQSTKVKAAFLVKKESSRDVNQFSKNIT
jgi:hypothetical protein